MKIVVAGGSGFLGTPLVRELGGRHQVVVLSRNPAKVKAGRGVEWIPDSTGPWQDEVASADAVINLAGENIGDGRWTESRKRALVQSRIVATRALATVLNAHPRSDRAFVSASAIGYYGDRGDELLDEQSAPGNDFLANLCLEWEAAARSAAGTARLVILRFGIILARDGGALAKMLLPFRMFAGGPQGNGRQWMSWVDRDDVLAMIRWTIETPSVDGTYNVVAPAPVRNAEFARTLGAVLRRPAILPAPAVALRLGLGEMADSLLLASQRVVPNHAAADGFTFSQPALRGSLENSLRD